MFSRLSRGFKNSNIVGRFIYANVAVYVIVVFIGVFSVLFNFPSLVENCVGTLELSSSFHIMLCRPWSLFTYMFLHEHQQTGMRYPHLSMLVAGCSIGSLG